MRQHDYVAEVSCGGTVLEEYGTNVTDDGKLVSCWIQSEAGKEFAITWKFDVQDGSRGAIAKTYVDGSQIGHDVCTGVHGLNSKQYGGADVDDKTYKPFRFTPISLTDDLGVATHRDLVSLGTIAVVMFQGTKEKKLGAHCVQLGDVVKRDQPLKPPSTTHYHWGHVDEKKPLFTFRFMYRSREFLQAQEIIPYTIEDNQPQIMNAGPGDESPEPELVGQVTNIPIKDESDDEDVDALQRQLEEMQEKIQRIKRKRPPNQSTKVEVKTEKRIKPESGARQRPHLKYNGDVIDLTSD
ncbi:hypothetical protein BD410DRAFT_794659 [Rickenella mellea]|uniref:DUF7918 domain-containing protein n=1 Tax=Rickenella mellea TaxID=50990 RepID=A0A4Y7PRD9_9AGAM|nr:hypothetical protein BD410DRAFT_794659 [Rickenella mellea]